MIRAYDIFDEVMILSAGYYYEDIIDNYFPERRREIVECAKKRGICLYFGKRYESIKKENAINSAVISEELKPCGCHPSVPYCFSLDRLYTHVFCIGCDSVFLLTKENYLKVFCISAKDRSLYMGMCAYHYIMCGTHENLSRSDKMDNIMRTFIMSLRRGDIKINWDKKSATPESEGYQWASK